MNYSICTHEGCERPSKARGLCLKHYRRFSRHGHTRATRPPTWGDITKHPLYHTWGWIKRNAGKKFSPGICAEWKKDFRILPLMLEIDLVRSTS